MLGCLTEPIVLPFLVFGSLIGGWVWGRKFERSRQGQRPVDDEGDDD